ncbi:hypothetical protein CK203_029301 [Vitis vinifera]|uniref:Endonuclease/exonuclease/phosphatase domain-containing protein n=1 Tax=Vitis vinifera TaxID=29760 RepID=A0A438ISR3_VITVI|nr:hypothetical protein CK203_029301 [Vitis vinifera]
MQMKIRILSWNVRWANNRDKRKIIKSVIKSQRVDVVCLQETKIKEMTIGFVRSLRVGRHLDWSVVNLMDAAGDIMVFWDNRVFELVDLEEGEYSMLCHFKNYVDGVVWVFNGVYGSVNSRDREDFWEKLGSIRGLWSDPWCVGWDFNMIRFPEEHSRRWVFCINEEIFRNGRRFGAKGLSFAGRSFYLEGCSTQTNF